MSEDPHFVPTDLESIIKRAHGVATATGCTPIDVWLGPAEQRFMQAIFERSSAISVEDQMDVMMNGLQDGVKAWNGMTIRFMAAPGVRVGVSFEDPRGFRDPLNDLL